MLSGELVCRSLFRCQAAALLCCLSAKLIETVVTLLTFVRNLLAQNTGFGL